MAATSTLSGTSYVYSRRVVSHVRTYNWPPLQLNFWIFVMLLASSSIMGVFGYFITIQTQLLLPVPWYVCLAISSTPSICRVMLANNMGDAGTSPTSSPSVA
jgi:predicted histidine transporter YuiF (NhaC family)